VQELNGLVRIFRTRSDVFDLSRLQELNGRRIRVDFSTTEKPHAPVSDSPSIRCLEGSKIHVCRHLANIWVIGEFSLLPAYVSMLILVLSVALSTKRGVDRSAHPILTDMEETAMVGATAGAIVGTGGTEIMDVANTGIEIGALLDVLLPLVVGAATAAHPRVALDPAPRVVTMLLRPLAILLIAADVGKIRNIRRSLWNRRCIGLFGLFSSKQSSLFSGFKPFLINVGVESTGQCWFMSSPPIIRCTFGRTCKFTRPSPQVQYYSDAKPSTSELSNPPRRILEIRTKASPASGKVSKTSCCGAMGALNPQLA
jgi:hypothetical protein